MLADRLEARVYGEGAPEAAGRVAMLVERGVAEPLPGERAEVVRVQADDLLAVGDGRRVVGRQEARCGALVPALGERGRPLDDTAEGRDRAEPVLRFHGAEAFRE